MLSINGVPAAVSGRKLEGVPTDSNWPAGLDIFELLTTPANYEHGGARGLSIRFGRPRLSANERITLASMMHSCAPYMNVFFVLHSEQIVLISR